jgi:hypothetical protein
MKIGGWKTRSVFERYNIVSQGDIRDAMTSLEAKQQRDNEEAAQQKSAAAAENQFGHDSGHDSGTIAEKLPNMVHLNCVVLPLQSCLTDFL